MLEKKISYDLFPDRLNFVSTKRNMPQYTSEIVGTCPNKKGSGTARDSRFISKGEGTESGHCTLRIAVAPDVAAQRGR